MWSPPVEGLVRAAGAARRALELDPDLGPAHAALANVLVYRDWDWEAAERGFRKALDLDPGSPSSGGRALSRFFSQHMQDLPDIIME